MFRDTRPNELSRQHRLNNSKDYRHVFAKPFKSGDALYTILARKNQLSFPRLGVIVSKKNIPKSVQRVRVKRIVRESFRTHKQLLENLDIVVICKRNCSVTMNQKLFKSLDIHWRRLDRKS